MAYATPEDLVARFGEQEMVRLTTPAGQDLDGVVAETAERALADASAMIDSYVRRRYRTPIDVTPAEISRVCLDIARYDLSTGDGKLPSEETKDRYKQAMDWLRDIAVGKVVLELDEVAPGDESYAQAESRRPVYGAEGRW
jgi:phage gp36-like protein